MVFWVQSDRFKGGTRLDIIEEMNKKIINLEKEHKMADSPKLCIDPIMKYCQSCPYGSVTYGEDVETSA